MDERVAAWAASGSMALTGRPDRPPLGPPAPMVGCLQALGSRLSTLSGGVTPAPLSLLGERAAILGLHRRGDISCGGATRIVRTSDGWIAATLARDDDRAAVAAWLGLDGEPADPWAAIERVAAIRSARWLEEGAVLLGLPVTSLPEPGRTAPRGAPPFGGLPVTATRQGSARPTRYEQVRVVDLSSMWAGPLCGHLLVLAGARVIKVESTDRPDGARRGPAAFYDLLNGDKSSVALDFRSVEGVRALHRLIASADVVVEASRPRALGQLGIVAAEVLAAPDGPQVWVSITGYGRDGGPGQRVAFGDDAAVAGGLVVHDDRGPCFCADAVADPISGVVAATAALVALADGGRWLVDVAMRGVAADLAGPDLPVDGFDGPVAAPRARVPTRPASPLGRETRSVLADLDR